MFLLGAEEWHGPLSVAIVRSCTAHEFFRDSLADLFSCPYYALLFSCPYYALFIFSGFALCAFLAGVHLFALFASHAILDSYSRFNKATA
jgi:hypothetical protein